MEFYNLTSKSVTIVDEQGNLITEYPPRGFAQCEVEERKVQTVDGVCILEKRFKPPIGLPPQDVDLTKFYIVDESVAESVRDTRFDILTPSHPHPSNQYPNAYLALMKI